MTQIFKRGLFVTLCFLDRMNTIHRILGGEAACLPAEAQSA